MLEAQNGAAGGVTVLAVGATGFVGALKGLRSLVPDFNFARFNVSSNPFGVELSRGGSVPKIGGVSSTSSVIAPEKFKYIFGEVDSSTHNLARSEQLLTQMKRLGISNNAEGRTILTKHFEEVTKIEGNISKTFTNQYGNFEVRDSLFIGPSGNAAKFESTFRVNPDGTREFSTVIPKGGLKGNGYERNPREF